MTTVCDAGIFDRHFVLSTAGIEAIQVQKESNRLEYITTDAMMATTELCPSDDVSHMTFDQNATYRNYTTILDHYPEYYFFKMVFNIPFGLSILIGNALTIHAIRKYPALRTVTNVFIQSLSYAAILNAFPVMLLRFLIFIEDPLWSNGLHMMMFSILALSPSLALYSHAALAFDRYIAVNYPLKYKDKITMRCAKNITLAIWVFNFVVTFVMVIVFWKQTSNIEFKCVLHLPLILPVALYYGFIVPQVAIFLTMCAILYSIIFVRIKLRIKASHDAKRERTRDIRKATKAVKTTAIVLLVLIICWAPFSLLTGTLKLEVFFTKPLWFVLYEISVYLLYANSCINPIIYWTRIRDFKVAYTSIIKGRPEV